MELVPVCGMEGWSLLRCRAAPAGSQESGAVLMLRVPLPGRSAVIQSSDSDSEEIRGKNASCHVYI